MFPLRQVLNNARRVAFSCRAMSSVRPHIAVDVDKEGIATVTMQRPPLNIIKLNMFEGLIRTFDEIEKDKCKAMIITSSLPTVFTAGLDLTEVYNADENHLEILYTTIQELWIKLYGSKLITAAAINGHAPASGCLLSLCCERRVMVNHDFVIGMNETPLGLFIPTWLIMSLANVISPREAEIAVTTAKLFSVEEALKVGLVDELATDKSDAIEKCKNFIKQFDGTSPVARSITKLNAREAPLAWMQKNRRKDLQFFLEFAQTSRGRTGKKNMLISKLNKNHSYNHTYNIDFLITVFGHKRIQKKLKNLTKLDSSYKK